jgi:hypothetical protein
MLTVFLAEMRGQATNREVVVECRHWMATSGER